MTQEPIPYERLSFFLEQLQLTPQLLAKLEPHQEAFVAKSEDFGREFCEYFFQIPRTRLILEQGDNRAQLEKILGNWFASLFRRDFDPSFISYLWDSGVKHVQLSLDQRFVNLGYAMARDFCHQVIREDLPLEDQEEVAGLVDRMLDFCVLVATDSFITMTSRCDRHMIEGIAHQVRNPITVIGGNIKRLQKQAAPDSPAFRSYEMVLQENLRLERMVGDIAVYTGLFQNEPQPGACHLTEALSEAMEWLTQRGLTDRVNFSQELSPEHNRALADCRELVFLLRYLLENAAEAADPRDPRVTVISKASRAPGFVRIAIHNTGEPPQAQDLEEILSPFHSSKPMGTGLGLPIASLAARRNLGSLSLEPGPQGGAVCHVDLPAPPES